MWQRVTNSVVKQDEFGGGELNFSHLLTTSVTVAKPLSLSEPSVTCE